MALMVFLWSETGTFRVTVFSFNAIFAKWLKAFFVYCVYYICEYMYICTHSHICTK